MTGDQYILYISGYEKPFEINAESIFKALHLLSLQLNMKVEDSSKIIKITSAFVENNGLVIDISEFINT